MLRTLFWQLLQSLPPDQQTQHVPRLLENQTSLKYSNDIIIEIQRLSKEHRRVIYCALDGIDESVDDWNDVTSGPLGLLVKLLQSIDRIRLLLVGRQSSLRSALQRWPLQVEVTRELVYRGLAKLIAFELDNCRNITDEAVREKIRMDLEARSTVMFLWIKLVFKELRSAFSSLEISRTLHRLPEGLDREYQRLFMTLMMRLNGRSNNPSIGMERSKTLFSIIAGALRPLTTSELCLLHAVISSPTTSNSRPDSLLSEEGIIDACGDFITVHDKLVYLGHLFESSC
jgi:hypothetical protein